MKRSDLPKPPKLVKTKYVWLLVLVAVLAYAGLIYLALNNIANSTVFMILLGAMVLLPSLIILPVYRSITNHFDEIMKKIDEDGQDEDEIEN
ncbi:MAG: hypothetical protein MJ085_05500 [Clostridia bacterium]|nr:hypothetical protein [Clostridia bacterium]